MFLLSEDSSGSPRRKKSSPVPVEQTQTVPTESAPEERKAPEEKPRPKKTEKAPAPADDGAQEAAAEPAPAPVEKTRPAPKKPSPADADANGAAPAPAKKVASGKMLGTLTLNPGPNVAVVYGGSALPKQVGKFDLPVTADSGTIEVGDGTSPFKLSLDYAVSGGGLTLKVNSVPFAIVSVNGPSKGRTPVSDIRVEKTMTVLEMKQPGSDTGMTLRLLFRPN